MKKPVFQLPKRRNDEQGATIIEYVLIVVLLSIAAIAAFSTVANSINTKFNSVAQTINS